MTLIDVPIPGNPCIKDLKDMKEELSDQVGHHHVQLDLEKEKIVLDISGGEE